MINEGRYYDKLYVRKYEPDAVRHIKQYVQGGAYYNDHIKKEPYMAGGDKFPHPTMKFKHLLRQRQKTIETQKHFISNKFTQIPRASAFSFKQEQQGFREMVQKRSATECQQSRKQCGVSAKNEMYSDAGDFEFTMRTQGSLD